ncbi:MAG: 50S ribosomal protein L4 [Candidatus Omnitrophica bacterium]|nr:50S ribosomal protein L4 [Candidatus Omnitrophota bacterium]
MKLPVYNTEGKEIESIDLDPKIFDGTVNTAAVYQVVNAYRSNQRRGLAATKTRGEVSGGGKKPWRQKGTGRARVGSTRSPLWRHGGVTFGPHPRDFSYNVSDKLKAIALKSGLNAKVKENSFIILEDLCLVSPKTKEASRILENLKIKSDKGKAALLLLGKKEVNLERAFSNIPFLDFHLAKDTNVYEVLSHAKLIITKDGFTQLLGRLKR